MAAALGVRPVERLLGTDLVLVLADEAAVRSVVPDATRLERLPVRGVVVTAPAEPDGGHEVDVVSRWFGGSSGVAEDPVTGSAHSQFARYWAQRLGRDRFVARQVSARGGTVGCELTGDRVLLTGTYRRYLDGTITLPDPPG